MRRRLTLFFSLVAMAGFLSSPSRALAAPETIVLKALVVNPSETETQKVPIELPLPREVGKKDVIDLMEGLEIRFNPDQGIFFVMGELSLKPGEQKKLEVRIEDVWRIAEEDLRFQMGYAQKLEEILAQGPYADSAREVSRTILSRLEKILSTQNEPVAPSKHIDIHRENLALLEEVRTDIRFLEKISTDKMPSPDGMIESDRLDQRGEDPAESVKTITLNVLVRNPSETERALLPVDYYLPRELKKKDVLNPSEFEVRNDVARAQVYLHKDEIAMEAGESRIFEVIVRDVWRIDPELVRELEVKAAGMSQGFEGTRFEPAAEKMRTEILKKADEIRESQTTAVGRQFTEHIAAYVENLSLLKKMQETLIKMAQIEAVRIASPETTPESLALEVGQVSEETSKEKTPGVIAREIMKEQSLDKKTLWKVIFSIVGFLGLLSLVFYILWWIQARRDNLLLREEISS